MTLTGWGWVEALGHGKKKKEAVSQALFPQNLLQPLFSLIRSKVTKYMPMARKNKKIATFIALLHFLCGYNALNLTVTTVYLLAAVTFMFLEALMATSLLFSNYLLLAWVSTPYIDIECVSICGFVGISH